MLHQVQDRIEPSSPCMAITMAITAAGGGGSNLSLTRRAPREYALSGFLPVHEPRLRPHDI